jgi:four helix bundle protein
MNKQELKDRTKTFAFRVLKMVDALPKTTSGYAVAKQVVRSGSSVGANYRAACMARSRPEFIAKLGIALEEADETCYWLELISEGKILPARKILPPPHRSRRNPRHHPYRHPHNKK